MARLFALLYGAAAYLFFLGTFLYAIGFVGNLPGLKTIDGPTLSDGGVAAWVVDLVLLGLFAVQHSVMARQGFKRWWTRMVPKTVERSTFVVAASALLALLIWQWQPIAGTVWQVSNPVGVLVIGMVFWLGWGVLLLATFLINHFELFGLQQVYDHLRGRTGTDYKFRTPLLYKHVRHPIYLGFVIAFWATPHMTVGHLLFAVATTGYIMIGIFFEERDLVAHFGDEYRRYRARVPMLFPFPGKRLTASADERPVTPQRHAG